MNKEEKRTFCLLRFQEDEIMNSIEGIKQKLEADNAYFEKKIKNSKGLRKDIWKEMKDENQATGSSFIEQLEFQLNLTRTEIARLRGELK